MSLYARFEANRDSGPPGNMVTTAKLIGLLVRRGTLERPKNMLAWAAQQHAESTMIRKEVAGLRKENKVFVSFPLSRSIVWSNFIAVGFN